MSFVSWYIKIYSKHQIMVKHSSCNLSILLYERSCTLDFKLRLQMETGSFFNSEGTCLKNRN